MSDITEYFMTHARQATLKARGMRRGSLTRHRQRVVARVYHLLAKEAAWHSKVTHLDDYRRVQDAGKRVAR